MSELLGKSLGQYEILAILGEGGMAAVYRARQQSIKRDVAIKVIKTGFVNQEEFAKRFQREAETIASLNHPHIIKVFDYGRQDDTVYLVMDLLMGGSLADLLTHGPLPLNKASALVDQIASALDHAHRRGIIHRDLKPQNVLLNEDGYAFLTDFGIAKLMQSDGTNFTQSGVVVGTPAYISPEQWKGEPIDARADLYSLGVMLFEMLTGNLPFTASTPFGLMHLHVYDPPPALNTLRSDLPDTLQAVLDKTLAKNPDDRFQSASDVAAAFKEAASGTPSAAATTKLPRTKTASPSKPAVTEAKTIVASPTEKTSWAKSTMGRAVIGVTGLIVILAIAGSVAHQVLSQPTVTPTIAPADVQPTVTQNQTSTIPPTVATEAPSATSVSVASGSDTESATASPEAQTANAFNDEFDDSNTLADWKQSNVLEGYPNVAEKLDINTTIPGSLYIVPYASTWYADYRGVFLYKELSGDFIVTARVKATGKRTTVPTLDFSLAGLLVRAPRSDTAETWQPGMENWLLIATGYGNSSPGKAEIESKLTINSESQVFTDNATTGWVNLRIARLGNVFILMSQGEGQDWVINKQFSMPDMPSTVQVGIHAYTNYPALPQDTREYNQTLLETAPADLVAEVDYIRFMAPQVPQDITDALATGQNVDDATLLKYLAVESQK